MSDRPTTSPPEDETVRVLDGGFWLVVAMAAVLRRPGRGDARPRRPGARRRRPGAPAGRRAARLVDAGGSPSDRPAPAAPVDVASFLYPTPRPAPADRADRPGRPGLLAHLVPWRTDPRLLRLHPLPRRLPGDDRHGGPRDGARSGPGSHAVFVTRRPGARHDDLAQGVRPLPAGRLRRPDRDGRRDPGDRRRLGRPLRPGRDGRRRTPTRCRTRPTSTSSTPTAMLRGALPVRHRGRRR